MFKLIRKIIITLENSPTNFYLWTISFLSLIIIRILIENWLGIFSGKDGVYFFYHVSYNFLFFSTTYFLFLGIIKKYLGVSIKKASNILLWGYLVILLPPLIDYLISHGKGFLSFYGLHGLRELGQRFLTFFGDNPEFGITYGVRFEIALTVIFILIYAYIKTKKITYSLFLSLFAYSILFVLGTFPSWITIATDGFSKGFLAVNEIDIAKMFLTPVKLFSQDKGSFLNALSIKMSLIYSLIFTAIVSVGLFLNCKEKFLAFLKNCRLPQIVYHGGLFFVGAGLGIIFTHPIWEVDFFNLVAFLVVLLAICLAWLASVVVNDLADQKIDKETNEKRPLIKNVFTVEEYKTIGIILFVFSVLFSAIVNFKVALLLVAYQALAWIYSAWPLRLKRFAYLASFISAAATFLILVCGFILVSADQNISRLPFSISALLIIGFTLSLPVKDFKDIEGDKKDKVWTIPVIFGEYWGKVVVGSGVFISFILSVLLLNESRLFAWALLFGGASFWTILNIKKEAGGKINSRNIVWWILLWTAFYLFVLTKIVAESII